MATSVLTAGGGVGGLEVALALQSLAAECVELTLKLLEAPNVVALHPPYWLRQR